MLVKVAVLVGLLSVSEARLRVFLSKILNGSLNNKFR